MAPYTMKINIKDPVSDVAYIGSSRLPGDGYITVTGRNCPANNSGSTTEGASLAKGGGHQGLFIATLFSVAGCLQNLLVWTSMSAKNDGKVIVQVRCLAYVNVILVMRINTMLTHTITLISLPLSIRKTLRHCQTPATTSQRPWA